MDTCRVIQVVETTILRRGKGIIGDPIRVITQYWGMDGKLLCEVDPNETAIQGQINSDPRGMPVPMIDWTQPIAPKGMTYADWMAQRQEGGE